MLSKLLPYRIFDKFDDISPEYLTSLGVKFLFSDVDNTLAPYEVPEPDDRIRAWLDSLKEAGITVVLVSNNHGDRIELFNRSLGLDAYADCKKPGKKRLGKIMKSVGATAEDSAFLGDQIFTDCIAAHRAGIRFALVKPIQPVESKFFRMKRFFERPFVKKLDWLNPKNAMQKIRNRKKKAKDKE